MRTIFGISLACADRWCGRPSTSAVGPSVDMLPSKGCAADSAGAAHQVRREAAESMMPSMVAEDYAST
jgi:hypothetical protein